MVTPTRQSVNFYLKALSSDASSVVITNQATGEILYDDLIYEETIVYYYDEFAPQNLVCEAYLTNEAGEKVSDNYSVTVNTQFEQAEEFVLNYKNPGEIGITYNDDDTMNLYANLDFSAENEQLYYQITLNQNRYKSREPIFCALGLKKEAYSITSDVCIDVDGIQYSIYSVTPSGMVNAVYADSIFNNSLSENSLNLSVYSYSAQNLDLGGVVLMSSSGERIEVGEDDWQLTADSYYEYTANFENEFEFVDVYITYVQPESLMEGFVDYEGSLSTQYDYRIYK
jgi:hypothetical protein